MRLHFQTQRALFVTWRAALALFLLPFLGCTEAANPLTQPNYHAIKNFVDLGSNPTALIEGNDRNLYGTMRDGGSKWEGVVFKVKQGRQRLHGAARFHQLPERRRRELAARRSGRE